MHGRCRVPRRRPCKSLKGLEAETLRRSEQPMRSTWAQVQGPEAETLQEFSAFGGLSHYRCFVLAAEQA